MSDCVALELANLLEANVLSKANVISNKEEAAKVKSLIDTFRKIGEDNNAKKNETTSKKSSTNIWFSSKENKELSNLAVRPFTFDGKKFESVEHAYQSLKSGELDTSIYGLDWGSGGIPTGGKGGKKAKTEGNYNINLMEDLIKESFAQNPDKLELLKRTEGSVLTHKGGKDKFWEQKFPELLTKVRDTLIKEVPEPKESKAQGASTGKGVNLNKGQKAAVENISKWYKSDKSTFLLLGRGGTGKTTAISEAVKALGVPAESVVFVAPSHAAVKVLINSNKNTEFNHKENYGTVASLLSKIPDDSFPNSRGRPEFVKSPVESEFSTKAKSSSVIVIDESSMLSREDYYDILSTFKDNKVIFMGDIAQLPPIEGLNKKSSPEAYVFTEHLDNGSYSELTEVMRQKPNSTVSELNNYIYSLTRQVIDMRRSGNTPVGIKGNEKLTVEDPIIASVEVDGKVQTILNLKRLNRDVKEVVRNSTFTDSYILKSSTEKWVDSIVESFLKNGNNTNALMFNQSLHENSYFVARSIREAYLSSKGKTEIRGFTEGDLVLFNEKRWVWAEDSKAVSVIEGRIEVDLTDTDSRLEVTKMDRGVIKSVTDPVPLVVKVMNKKTGKLNSYKSSALYSVATIEMATGETIRMPVYSGAIPGHLKDSAEQNFSILQVSKGLDFGYVNNVHKAQGSTYKETFVFMGNIINGYVRNQEEFAGESLLKALYVAVSRPREKLVIGMDEEVYPKVFSDIMAETKC